MPHTEPFEYIMGDSPRAEYQELQSATEQLLLDATASADFTEGGTVSILGGQVERQATYVLPGEIIGEDRSRLVAARIGERGMQAVMLIFAENDLPPFDPWDPDSEPIRTANETGPFATIDFFSITMGNALFEGTETLADAGKLEKLRETMCHPELREVKDRSRRGRFTPAVMILIEAAGESEALAQRYFMCRKMDQFLDSVPKEGPGRGELEAAAVVLKKRMLEGDQ